MDKRHKKLRRGFIQVYTGDGKGKTTAALGLALRAAGAGLKVYIGQFMKSRDYSEIKALNEHREFITIEQFGAGRFVGKEINAQDKQHAQDGFNNIKKIIKENQYDLVILDEINVVMKYGLIDENEVIEILRAKPIDMEIVLTGRGALASIIELADLVTEMRNIKHYYQMGIKSRMGIEK